jgi:hypothetical protein
MMGLLAAGMLVAAAGCVNEQDSLFIRGVVAPPGTAETQSATCVVEDEEGNEQETEIGVTNYSCSGSQEPGAADSFWGSLNVELSEFESEDGGQLGPPKQIYDEAGLCSELGNYLGDAPQSRSFRQYFEDINHRYKRFVIAFDMVNRLDSSEEAGAEGQGGGGGGGFPNLELDKNAIETAELKVRFPDVSNSGPDGLGLDRDIKKSFVVESSGGAILFNTALFQLADLANPGGGQQSPLRQMHRQVVLDRTGLGSYNSQAQRTTVTVKAKMWVSGKTLGGRKVESNRIEVPIRVCGEGCGTTPQCAFSSEG